MKLSLARSLILLATAQVDFETPPETPGPSQPRPCTFAQIVTAVAGHGSRARRPPSRCSFRSPLAVVAVPEGLPAVVTILPGDRRAAHGVQTSPCADSAVETLGKRDGHCTDKTGTLNDGCS